MNEALAAWCELPADARLSIWRYTDLNHTPRPYVDLCLSWQGFIWPESYCRVTHPVRVD